MKFCQWQNFIVLQQNQMEMIPFLNLFFLCLLFKMLTTNVLDPHILTFFNQNPQALILKSEDDTEQLLSILDETLRPPLKNNFSPAMSRRIDCIVPFVPFVPEERFVIAGMS